MKEDKIVLSYFPGLGDIMQFLTTCRRFSELGHKVFYSSRSRFRNPEIKELSYDINPYIIGPSDAVPNLGDGAGFALKNGKESFMANWEASHGLPAPYSKYPEIYYEPKIISEVEGKTLIDITATSGKGYYDAELIRDYINKNYNGRDDVLVCTFSDGVGVQIVPFDCFQSITVKNIFHYCDLIASCKKFVCLHSGGMCLASALQAYKSIDCDCIITSHAIHQIAKMTHHYFFDNINYITV